MSPNQPHIGSLKEIFPEIIKIFNEDYPRLKRTLIELEETFSLSGDETFFPLAKTMDILRRLFKLDHLSKEEMRGLVKEFREQLLEATYRRQALFVANYFNL